MSDLKKKRNKRRKRNRIIASAAAVLLVAYFVLQYSLVQNSKIEEMEAVEGYINDSFITQGIVLREETVLRSDFTGEIDFVVSEGQRISRGEKVADVYPSVIDVDNKAKLNTAIDLQEELIEVNKNTTPSSSELSMAYRNLMDSVVELSNMQASGDFVSIDSDIIKISVNMNKLYMATDEITDLSLLLTELSTEIDTLNQSISPATTSLYSSVSGYFIKSTDGYESIASLDNFLNFSFEEGNEIISNAIPYTENPAEYGKIVTDYRWYIACYVPFEVFERLEVGDTLQIGVENSEELQNCVITNLEKKGDEYLLILESEEDAQNAQIDRFVDLELVFKQYTGIKIPKNAIRLIDGELGVYVNFSEIAQFKNISPIFENENYFILPIDGDENNEVRLHDIVITNGRNLYDGKYI